MSRSLVQCRGAGALAQRFSEAFALNPRPPPTEIRAGETIPTGRVAKRESELAEQIGRAFALPEGGEL